MIKRPGNEFVIVDNSGKYNTTETPEMAPLMLTAASFDKGPEDLRVVSGDDFFRLYGEMISYEKHGQPAIQAANIIRNNGKLLIKRVVADNAMLANNVITATVSNVQVPKTDPITGAQVYIDKVTGNETTEATSGDGSNNDRAMINTANIKYNVVSVKDAKSLKEIMTSARSLMVEKDPEVIPPTPDTPEVVDEGSDSAIPGNIPLPIGDTGNDITQGEYTYPLFVIADNGRGDSSKRFNISPDYAVSKNLKFVLYKLNHIGSLNLDNEYIRFACDPDTIYMDSNMSLSESGKEMVQLQPAAISESVTKFISRVAEFSGIEREALVQMDILFGKNNKGESIPQITIDTDGYDLSSDFGMTLQNGSNGDFGSAPFGTEAYSKKLVDFFSGVEDASIFDVDEWKIEACVDANYPLEVKNAITKLVDFRKDFTFFRDLGIGLESHDAIQLILKGLTDTMYAANYCQSYDIVDPFTRKQIPVTICYSIARLLINHLNDHRNCPFCGEMYSINIPEAIDGTVSYIPRITPSADQKQMLYDLHLNYASMVNGILTIETQINSQTEETQCSYINNIFVVQNIIRDIRILCPRVRYSFIDQASGLDRYAQDVNNVLKQHTEEVTELTFEWSSDDVMLANHIFNATINIKFKAYADFEKFTIYVID